MFQDANIAETFKVKKSQRNKSITSSQLALKNRNIEEFREQIFLHCGMNLNIFKLPAQTQAAFWFMLFNYYMLFLLRLLIKYLHLSGKKGFEPLTPWFVATCSSPLSYKPLVTLNLSLIIYKCQILMLLSRYHKRIFKTQPSL